MRLHGGFVEIDAAVISEQDQMMRSERGLIDYIASVAPEPLRMEIERSVEYKIVFREYDWSTNEAK